MNTSENNDISWCSSVLRRRQLPDALKTFDDDDDVCLTNFSTAKMLNRQRTPTSELKSLLALFSCKLPAQMKTIEAIRCLCRPTNL